MGTGVYAAAKRLLERLWEISRHIWPGVVFLTGLSQKATGSQPVGVHESIRGESAFHVDTNSSGVPVYRGPAGPGHAGTSAIRIQPRDG